MERVDVTLLNNYEHDDDDDDDDDDDRGNKLNLHLRGS